MFEGSESVVSHQRLIHKIHRVAAIAIIFLFCSSPAYFRTLEVVEQRLSGGVRLGFFKLGNDVETAYRACL